MDNIIKIKKILNLERKRQENEICLIASENYASQDVLDACGHCIQNKYSEGYVPDKNGNYRRYYGGCEYVDKIEQLTIDLVRQSFKTKFANVQPHSGSSANLAVYETACRYWDCKPQDITIISHSLNSMSHLTHGSKASVSGRWFNTKQFETDENDLFNYNEFEKLIKETDGNIIAIVGFSAYPRQVDYNKIANIVKNIDKEIFVLVDSSHISGLIVSGLHQNPFDYDWGKAHLILSSTSHKTLRGPRHAFITTNDEILGPIIDKAVFPSLQGGALQNMIAALGIAMSESLQPSFKEYQEQVLKNIKAMEEVFNKRNVKMVSGGSDNHLILLDLRDKGISGKQLEDALSGIGIVVNKNAVKDDPRPKLETSGIRIGTAAITTRGAKEKDCSFIAHQICHMIDILTGEYDYDGITMYKDIFEQQLEKELTFKEVVLEIMKENTEHFCLEHPIYKKGS